jgi:hypothetical protein
MTGDWIWGFRLTWIRACILLILSLALGAYLATTSPPVVPEPDDSPTEDSESASPESFYPAPLVPTIRGLGPQEVCLTSEKSRPYFL